MMDLVKSTGAVGASVGIALALTFRNREAEAEAEAAWLESSWPRWGLPQKLFAGVWLSVMYPILAYVVISCGDKLMWTAIALHLVSNAIWVPAFVRWQTATIAVVNALLMVLSAAWIAIKFADALRLHARVMLWVYVAWVAYSASITSNFLFAESS